MNYYPYDSRNSLYKNILGAAASDESLTLRLLLHKDACVHDAFLRITKDGEETIEYKMNAGEMLGDYRFYSVSLPLLSEGLYLYDFRYTSNFGEFFVSKERGGRGVFGKLPGARFQQTVYKAGFKTPEFLLGGVIYQIFPDRFYASGEGKQNVPSDRFLRNDWGGTPCYLQNGTKETLGNDYFGGDLKGIEEKLPYIKSLGVTCIYLNPVFEAHSNHRYNTADYMKTDPLLGDGDSLKSLCAAARREGIAVIADGVFSHTGDDSVYFNKKLRYGTGGAYNDPDSPYKSWYKFGTSRDDYASWWGVKSLPETNENDPSFTEFITGKNGVLRHWLKAGLSGWRLDVADELPDEFLENIRKAVKEENPDAFILGEVWEDATTKISYGHRRKFLLGAQLDSVMNYPFAKAIVKFIQSGDADSLNETVGEICENYPKQSLNLLMNHIGTHDTARILTLLANPDENLGTREEQAHIKIDPTQLKIAKARLKAAAVLQYTLPGVPSLYYGDEAGITGGADPFCRGCYPWGQEDTELLHFYRQLGDVRKSSTALKDGDFIPYFVKDGVFAFLRSGKENCLIAAVNAGSAETAVLLPEKCKRIFGRKAKDRLILLPQYGYYIGVFKKK